MRQVFHGFQTVLLEPKLKFLCAPWTRSATMSRTAKFMKAVVEKVQATKRVEEMLHYEAATLAFEKHEKQVLDDLFAVIRRAAEQGRGAIGIHEEPVLKRYDVQAYMKTKGFEMDGDKLWWARHVPLK